MRGNRVAPDALDVVERRAEPDRAGDVRRAGLELVRQIVPGRALEGDAADHVSAAHERRHRFEQIRLPEQHADAGRTVELVPGRDVEVAAERLDVDRHVVRRLRSVDQDRDAARVRERDDVLDRIDRAERVGHVRDRRRSWSAARSAARARSTIRAPRSSIGATRSRAPRSSQMICHGTMFEWCSIAEMTISSPGRERRAHEGVGDEVDALGRVPREHDLADAGGVEVGADGLARRLVGVGGQAAQLMDAAMHVGVDLGVVVRSASRGRPAASGSWPRCRDRRAAGRGPGGGESGSCARIRGDVERCAGGDRRRHLWSTSARSLASCA